MEEKSPASISAISTVDTAGGSEPISLPPRDKIVPLNGKKYSIRELESLVAEFDSLKKKVTELETEVEWLRKDFKLQVPKSFLELKREDLVAIFEELWKVSNKSGPFKHPFLTEMSRKTSGDLNFGQDKYIGELLRGVPHGKGSVQYADGRRYEGCVSDGRLEGLGIYSWPNGAKYQGEYKNNRRNGQGCYKSSSGLLYQGGFKDDRQDGIGVLAWPDGRKLFSYFSNDQPHGEYMYISKDRTFMMYGIKANGVSQGQKLTFRLSSTCEDSPCVK